MFLIGSANFIIYCILTETILVLPVLILLSVLNKDLFVMDRTLLIRAVNCVLLVSSLFYIFAAIIILIVLKLMSPFYVEFPSREQIFGFSRLEWLVRGLPGVILPQLFWVKKLQKTLVVTIAIVISYFLLVYYQWKIETLYFKSELLERFENLFRWLGLKTILYIALISAMYILLKARSGWLFRNKA